MVANNWEFQTLEITESVLPTDSSVASDETPAKEAHGGPSRFHSRHQDCMEMYAPKEQVAEYLNSHSSWFVRCAEPMRVEPLGQNGYALVIGRFGSFGYEVEPKIGLELLAPQQGKYHIRTIPIPDYQAPGYDVDYNACMELVESLPGITKVEWELYLTVELHFPRFIQRLPHSLIQSTGDRLLNQIVRQVSRRLTRKVQEDFHQSLGVPFPVNSKKKRHR
ncbi:DUF1997 domain-containing protein [Anabaena sphaerica FACHB-251]|uniref:DUF1997 domain-containing protein n=1 Tax=Anabaena sphaerica FACHB-251 TaxID=2692883 RepID=A0A926WJT5_9NOST|nr:DUF1997 domain-containing protein [Anabaena sphaerica]MBD2295722.1 DUF1997 domain-containing protein [Anabaena sphaerica FACHB-251]